jgi:putative Mg2+ transporter-C (MgtC) family protein
MAGSATDAHSRNFVAACAAPRLALPSSRPVDENDFLQELSLLLPLLVASLLAAVLGWERETAGKSAGMRTHILVAIGAAAFVLIGDVAVAHFARYGQLMAFDPMRIIGAVVTGVSFLGAGTIFVTRGRRRVLGLTTAASIWTTAAVGMFAGFQRYVLAAGVTVLVFVVLRVLGAVEERMHLRPADETRETGS